MTTDPSGVSRRDFLKTTAIAAAAVPALSIPARLARSAYAGGSDQIKIGLVGCGGRGTGACSQALRADPGNVLWSMGDIFKDRLQSSHQNLLEEFKDNPTKINAETGRQFVGFDSYKQVIDSGVDAVVLTSYPNFRPAHIRYALEKGKHVFAEKPVAVDAVGLKQVLECGELAKQKNLALCIGFCWRYHPAMREIYQQILGGTIGDITGVHTTYHSTTLPPRHRETSWSDLEFQMRNWWHFPWISGDHIVEQAVHSIDRLSWAMGDKPPKLVNCLGGRAAREGPESGSAFDHFAAIYEWDNGLRAHHTCRQINGAEPSDNTDYVYGTKGRAVVNGWVPASLKCYDYSGKVLWAYKGKPDDMYQVEHNELFKSIRDGKPINDCPRAPYSVLMAIMGRMAAYTGKMVTWDFALKSQENLQPESLSWDMKPPEPVVAIPGKTKLL
jgi:predicted dehydrogenase